jgi:hypothetical protein
VVLGDDQERRQFYNDRQITAVLKKLTPQGSLVVETAVGDHEFDLHPEGLQGQPVPIVARLLLGGAVAAGPHRVRVLLDGEPPEVSNFATRPPNSAPLALGTPLRVELRVKDQSGVERVEIGFDKNSSGALEKEETVGEIKKPPIDGGYVFELPTKDLKPGEYSLLAQVTDRVGLQSQSRPLLLTVIMPPEPGAPTANPAAKKGVVLCVVKYRMATADADMMTVTLEGASIQPERTGRMGEFKFSDVPPGSYTLKAEGFFQNKMRRGELKGVMPSPPDKPPVLVIQLN